MLRQPVEGKGEFFPAQALPISVRVCNICGDVGHKSSLALCSKCKDGAEHIYCMRVSMDKLPDSRWMCEDCVTSKEKVKLTSAKSGQSVNQPNRGDMKFSKRIDTLMRKRAERQAEIIGLFDGP